MSCPTFDKFCGIIELTTGSFIIGYLNLIWYIIMTIWTGLDVFELSFLTKIMSDPNVVTNNFVENNLSIFAVSMMALLFLALFLPFIICLLVGLHQNNATYILAYLIYGTVFTVLVAIYAITISGLTNYMSFTFNTASKIVLEFLSFFLNIYFLLVIRSHYYRIKDPARGPA